MANAASAEAEARAQLQALEVNVGNAFRIMGAALKDACYTDTDADAGMDLFKKRVEAVVDASFARFKAQEASDLRSTRSSAAGADARATTSARRTRVKSRRAIQGTDCSPSTEEFCPWLDVTQATLDPSVPQPATAADKKSAVDQAVLQKDLKKLSLEQASLAFKGKVGWNVDVSPDARTVFAPTHGGEGYAVSGQQMQDNVLYEIKLDEVNGNFSERVGVVAQDPATLGEKLFGQRSEENLPPVLAVSAGCVWDFGNQRDEDRPYLKGLPKGSRVGLAIQGGRLRLYVDGEPKGMVASRKHPVLPRPCFFFVQVGFSWKKVTGQPLSTLEYK